jgi:hypothetical protein
VILTSGVQIAMLSKVAMTAYIILITLICVIAPCVLYCKQRERITVRGPWDYDDRNEL